MSCFFFSSRRRHTRWNCDWSSDVCSSDLAVRIGRESSRYYLLGYNPGEIPHDGRFRKIEVRVRGKGLTVRGRRGYYAPSPGSKAAPPKPEAGDPDLQEALDAPGFLDGIPLR